MVSGRCLIIWKGLYDQQIPTLWYGIFYGKCSQPSDVCLRLKTHGLTIQSGHPLIGPGDLCLITPLPGSRIHQEKTHKTLRYFVVWD